MKSSEYGALHDETFGGEDPARANRAAGSATTPEELCQVALAALGRDTQHDDDTAVLAVALDD